MTLKTRRPTRRTGWPRLLVSGNDKSGKSWSVAEFSGSGKVGRTVVVVLGEDDSRWDEYGLIDGARFELAEWDGTWRSLMETVEAAKEEAAKAVANGEPPFVLAIDTMTSVWESLKDWATLRARSSKKNKKLLEEDPDAEIDVTSNYWNDAKARHRSLMRVLLTFPGIVVLICRGSEVTEFQNGQPVAGRKTWSVESEKNLPFDVSSHVQLARGERAKLVSASGVHVQIRPGENPPERLPSDWSLEWLIFDRFRLNPAEAAAGGFTVMRPEITPEEIRDEAIDPWSPSGRIRELYDLAKAARYAMAMPNENGKDELLSAMLVRIGAARKKAREALEPEDSWLVAIDGMSSREDAERVRGELTEAFAKAPDTDPRLIGLREAFGARSREITAPGTAPQQVPAAGTSSPQSGGAQPVGGNLRDASRPADAPAGETAAPDAGEAGEQVSETDFVKAFYTRLEDTGDLDGIEARRHEVSKALTSKTIAPGTASELYGDIQKKKRTLQAAA